LRLTAALLAGLEITMPASPLVWVGAVAAFTPVLAKAAAQPQNKTDATPPATVIVNRTVPKVTPPSAQTGFSDTPSDSEIWRAHIFSEPLTPVGKTTPQENHELAQALTAFLQRTNGDDFAALNQFLSSHPDSPWRASLLTGLGGLYRHTGWFSKALAAWEEAWKLAKDETQPQPRATADLAVAELAELNARLGRYDRLDALFAELQGRELNPAVSEKIHGAQQGLWLMHNRPEQAFRCGPMALNLICGSKIPPELFQKKIFHSRSTPQGMSLSSICDLANELGMNYQMARRRPGSTVVLSAVIHWKVGHYAAVLKKAGDKYLVDDPTFGEGIWITQSALDAEASGYFLVPAGDLPAGWEPVSVEEGKTIWGKGNTNTSDKSRTRPCDDQTSSSTDDQPMAYYNFHLMLVSLHLFDTPVGYTPPRGPAAFLRITYNQRDPGPPIAQPLTFTYANLGPKWTFNWLSYIVDDPTNSADAAYCYLSGGGYETYTNFNATTSSYAPQADSHTLLIRTSSANYERDLPDGSKQLFTVSDGMTNFPRKIFLTELLDPVGNALSFIYDSNLCLVAAVDAIGQVSTLTYGLTNDIRKITKVTDPFGRYATFQYDTNGLLTNITDIIGITSAFTYASNFITSLTTPYGTTTFATGGGQGGDARNLWLQATDPLGQTERVEYISDGYDESIPGFNIPDSDPGNLLPAGLNLNNIALSWRNSFFWNKAAMQLAPGNYAQARITHWLHSGADFNVCSGTIESTKEPLEDRVWRTYPGQSNSYTEGTNNSPSVIARVLDDGSSQIYRYQYNSFGKVTQFTDPTNRVTVYTYNSNNIDLLQVAQQVGTNYQVLAQFTYATNHLPLTAVDAAGQTNYFGYNAFGQLIGLTNPLNQVTTMAYDTNGYLTNITGALPGATTSFTYDGYGRVRTVTDSQGYTLTTDYDAAGRTTKVTYPDGSFRQFVYNRLDPILAKDRRGHWSTKLYDALRRVTDTVDALGRRTHFEYCGCGSLSSITDPLRRVTSWLRDIQGRATTKVYPDNTQITYNYETNSSRLKSVTDAKSQTTQYQYFIDNDVKQVSYSNALIATPTVSFSYDTNYNRILSMIDGAGTTTYSYYTITNGQLGAGKLQNVDGPWTNNIVTYFYDALGRVTNRSIAGVAQTLAFDPLGRVTALTNALGSFTNVYVGATARIATNFYPNGQQTVFSFYGNTNDDRLQQIQNLLPNGANLSSFAYTYDADGQITTWTRQTDANSPTVFSLGYDTGDQLLSAILTTNTMTGAVLSQYLYGYDLAGNRLSEQIQAGTNSPASITAGSFNNLNQLTNLSGASGPMLFAGSLNKLATVSVNSNTAFVNPHTTNFTGYANVSAGTNAVQVTATDTYGNSRTNNYHIVVTNNGFAEALTYDLDGNEISATTCCSTNTYEWDAADRLTAINLGVNRSEFAYDGLGRRIQIVEKQNGTNISTRKYLWCGDAICEELDANGASVTKRFFEQGEQVLGTNYYFARDYLGSIREVSDSTGALRARFEYDPYGRRTKLWGSFDGDFGFTGYYIHLVSGLNLAQHRQQDPNIGRWLSRDPLAERAGMNLYTYVGNNPPVKVDPLGLDMISLPPGAEPPSGYNRCGYQINGDGSKVIFWCKPDEPQPIPSWMQPPPDPPSQCKKKKPEDCWGSLPTDKLAMIPLGAAKPAAAEFLNIGCCQCCNDNFFQGGDEWNACMANCEIQKFRMIGHGASTGLPHRPLPTFPPADVPPFR
jgi:RHS repeat-associated protein